MDTTLSMDLNGNLGNAEKIYPIGFFNDYFRNEIGGYLNGELGFICGKKLEPKYLTPYYILLWVKYLDKHPELVEYASQFDEFNDKFRGKSINCQADVIRAYVKGNRNILLRTDLVKELSNIIREIA